MAFPNWLGRVSLEVVSRLPQNRLSRFVGRMARAEHPRPLVKIAVRAFARAMDVETADAERPMAEYPSLHDFFVRRLRPGLRRVDPRSETLVSPCDGIVGEFGAIENGTLIQAKGRHYSVGAFLEAPDQAAAFEGGTYLTFYLSPRHYHRVHSPCAGMVVQADHIPGGLLPVNQRSIHRFDGVFVHNERLTTWIDSERFGRIAVVMVGATCVGEISASYDSTLVTNRPIGGVQRKTYAVPPRLNKGEELGVFHMGSTVVVLLPPQPLVDLALERDGEIQLGQAIVNAAAGKKKNAQTH